MANNKFHPQESVVQTSSHLKVLGIVLAGGKGTRLYPLTRERAKPAVPFGGKYRIIDFVLSNFVNSGIHSIYVLTQFLSQSLLQHLSEGWQFGGMLKSHFIINVPAQMRSENESWYRGTADAIYQNINLIEQSDPHLVAIFGADHIYRMNVAGMIDFHRSKRADVTVAAIPVARTHAREFGVIEVNDEGRIMAFHEKKPNAPTMPDDPHRVYASMGNYIFSTPALLELLKADAKTSGSYHDFGKDILPHLAGKVPMYAYNFESNCIPGEIEDSVPYWRDVGTIEAYYEANMDLNNVKPDLNLTTVSGRCAARAIPILRRSSYSTNKDGAAKRSTASSRGDAFFPAAGCESRFWDAVCASTQEPRSKVASSWTTATSGAAQSCAALSSTRTSASPRTPPSATTSKLTAPRDGM